MGTAGWAVLLLAVAVLTSGCQGFALLDQPPVAKFTVLNLSGETELRVGERVVLDASGSTDPQGYALAYEWDLKSAFASLAKLNSTSGRIVWFYPDEQGTDIYYVSLRVTARSQSDGTELTAIPVRPLSPGKILLRVSAIDGNGTVEPWGARALFPTAFPDGIVALKATPNRGFRFSEWIVSNTGWAEIVDRSKAETSLSVTSGPVTIQALFVATELAPQFLGWKKTFPNGLLRVDGDTGLVSPVGDGSFSGQMVSLARSPGAILYGAGYAFATPIGAQLFVIDQQTGEAGLGLDFKHAGVLTTIASLAFSDSGDFYAVEKTSTPRLFKVDPKTAILSSGRELLLNNRPVAIDSLAFSVADGTFFGTDGTSLFKVMATGAVTRVGWFGGIVSLTSLTITKDGRLFAIDDGASSTSIYSIDTETGVATALVGLSSGLLSFLVEP